LQISWLRDESCSHSFENFIKNLLIDDSLEERDIITFYLLINDRHKAHRIHRKGTFFQLSLFDSSHKEMFDVPMPQLLIYVSTVIFIQEFFIFLYYSLSTMFTASLSRFHSSLCHTPILILLLKENDTIHGVSDPTLRISCEDPRCEHTIPATIVYLESHVGEFEFLWDLLVVFMVVFWLLLLWRWCC
jgi:hypothetical protein